MGTLATSLDNLHIETSSPDGRITSVFRPIAEVSITFRDDSYRGYTESGLEQQLSIMAERWWTQYRDAREAAIARATGEPPVTEESWDAKSCRFRAERDETGFDGLSPRRAVYVSGTGLRKWNVVIRDGGLAELDEAEFAAELAAAYAAAIRSFQVKLNRLRDKHFPV